MIDREGSRRTPIDASAPSRRIPAEEIAAAVWLWPMLGATLAMEPDVIRGFAPLSQRLPAGLDFVLPLRAAAMKGFYYVSEPLVLYRRHGGNMSNFVTDRASRSVAAGKETHFALQLSIQMQRYDDIGVLQATRSDDKALVKLRIQVLRRLHDELRQWSRHRAALWAAGMLPTWIDEAEMLARPLNSPQTTDLALASESAHPGHAPDSVGNGPILTRGAG